MEFISADEFLKQSKEVQKVFLDWWKLSIGDIFLIEKTTSFSGDKHNFIECFLTGFEVADLTETERKRIICPLLTEGQLRKFIEDKTECNNLELKGNIETCEYDLVCYKEIYSAAPSRSSHNLGKDTLQAYWKVACEIAKENVENEYK